MTNTERITRMLACYIDVYEDKKVGTTLFLADGSRVVGDIQKTVIEKADRTDGDFLFCVIVNNAVMIDPRGNAHAYDQLAILPEAITGVGATA